MITDDQITALAREYAEEMCAHMIDDFIKDENIRDVELAFQMIVEHLLRRYCLVEKSKVETKYKESLAALESNDNEDVKWGTYRLSLLDHLFPEIAKEVEG